MAKVCITIPNTLIFEFHQEKGDKDYGSCLWARFYLDLDNYSLLINSDCGDYSYTWPPSKAESFVHLLARCRSDYLLNKLSGRSVVDALKTYDNILELIKSEDYDVDDSILKEIEGICHCFTYDAIAEYVSSTIGLDVSDVYQCIATDYPNGAKKIVEIFLNFIVPELIKIEQKKNAYL